MISSIRLILIFITFLLILHEIISQEVKKNFRNYYKVIVSKNLSQFRQAIWASKGTRQPFWRPFQQKCQRGY